MNINEIKEYAQKICNRDRSFGWEIDKIYECVTAAYNKEIELSEENEDLLNYIVVYNLLNTCDVDEYNEVFQKYALSFNKLENYLNDLDVGVLRDLSQYYEFNNDPTMFFKVVYAGANSHIQGMMGGFALVNTLINIDVMRLMAAECLMEGKGCEKDYPQAFLYLMRYHTDHLTVKHGSDNLSEETLAKLYHLMEKDYSEGQRYPGLIYSLIQMYGEGIGTTYNYAKFQELSALASEEDASYQKLLTRYLDNYTEKGPCKNIEAHDWCVGGAG